VVSESRPHLAACDAQPMERSDAFSASSRRFPLLAVVVSIAALYFAKEVLVPLALAVLFTFLLTPLVTGLERLRLGRIPSVMLVWIVSFFLIGGVGWIVANQLIEIVNQLPSYTSNIREKMESFRGPHGGSLAKATDSVQRLTKELSTSPPNQVPPAAPMRLPRTQARKSASLLPSDERPLPVQIVEPPPGALQSVRNLFGPLLAPLGTTGVVVVFTIVMLIKREDLRNRLLRLLGLRQLNLATQAFDDATQRISKYLRMQFLVNAVYAALITVGLYFIGLPTALLWGVMAGILRFVPYIGPIIGGALPLIMALAVFAGWVQPLLCLGLFVVIELTVAYIVEPWLYGTHTGISSLAILVAAIFWTALWGPTGLVLSTPLTVCLVVLGRYVPQLEFLHVLLGDEQALSPEVQLYQRLLAMDQREAHTVIELFLKDRSLVELYDTVIIPALGMAEEERHRGALDETRENFLIQSLNEFVAELTDQFREPVTPGQEIRVVCIPANDRADETTAGMLAQLLELAGYATVCFPVMASHADVLEELSIQESDVVCISALPPFALMNARSLSKRLRVSFPKLRIVVGLWNFSGGGVTAEQRLDAAFSVEVVTTLAQAIERVQVPVEVRI
jgi:predicted PurR-regulated permease PerM